MYYLRSRAAADAIKFTVDTSVFKVTIFVVYHHFNNQFLCILNNNKISTLGDTGKA